MASLKRIYALSDWNKLGLLLVLGLLLRLVNAWSYLWFDEQFSWYLAQLPLSQLMAATNGDVHPPLFYLILWAWGHIFGYSEIAMRMPSILSGLALIYLTYRLCRAFELPEFTTWGSTVIMTIAPYQIYYSQEVRMYEIRSFTFFLAALGLVEQRRWLLISGSVITLYLHNISPIFIAVLFSLGWFWRKDKWAHVIDGVIVAVLFVPGLSQLIHQSSVLSHGYWIPALVYLGIPRIIRTYAEFTFHTNMNPFMFATGLLNGLILLLVLDDLTSNRDKNVWFLAVLAFIPVLLLDIISIFWTSVLMARVVSACAPFYTILLVHSLRLTPYRQKFYHLVLTTFVIIIFSQTVYGRNAFKNYTYGDNQPGDGVYHFLSDFYVTYRYSPDEQNVVHVVNPAGIGLDSSLLSRETMAAFGVPIKTFDEVVCSGPKTWKFNWYEGYFTPESMQAEFKYLKERYGFQKQLNSTIVTKDYTRIVYSLDTTHICPRAFKKY